MTDRSVVVAMVVIAGVVFSALPATAQEASGNAAGWIVPRTADGRPDLQGVWANNNVTPLQRPEGLGGRERLTAEELARVKANADRLFGSDAGDAAFGDQFFVAALSEQAEFTSSDTGTGNYNQFWLVERDFDDRTALIVDPPSGRMPPLTTVAERTQEARTAYLRDHPADGPEDRGLSERCLNFGVPKLNAGYNSYTQIFQTPGYMALFHEMSHQARIIPMDGRPHLGDDIRQWNGDPRGRWDGDTLVVETTNLSRKSSPLVAPGSEHLHLIERYTRVGPDTLHYEVTLTDRSTWTRPWTVLIPLRRSDDAIFEYACHEGNYGMEGILAGHRAQEQAEARPASK